MQHCCYLAVGKITLQPSPDILQYYMSRTDLYSRDEQNIYSHYYYVQSSKGKGQPSISTANLITLAPRVVKKTTMKQKALFCGTTS